MDYVACKGTWRIEQPDLVVKGADIFVCPERDRCYHYHLSKVREGMFPFYDIVPMSLNKDGRLDYCKEFVLTPFPKEERRRKGDQFNMPPGVA
jgi:hypothetical protein